MSKTPRTDKAQEATLTPEYEYEGAESVAWEFARQLERELNEAKIKFMDQSSEVLELRKDKARMDWLQELEVCVSTAYEGQDLFGHNSFLNESHDLRVAIDEAMEAEQ